MLPKMRRLATPCLGRASRLDKFLHAVRAGAGACLGLTARERMCTVLSHADAKTRKTGNSRLRDGHARSGGIGGTPGTWRPAAGGIAGGIRARCDVDACLPERPEGSRTKS